MTRRIENKAGAVRTMQRATVRPLAALAFCAFSIAGAQATANATCQPLVSQAQNTAADTPALREIYAQATGTCPREYLDYIGQVVARSLMRDAQNDSARTAHYYEEAVKFSRDWRLFANLGSIYQEKKDWRKATESYQSALAAIQVLPPGKEPPSETIKEIVSLANKARALSPEFVPTRSVRGAPGAMAAERIGGLQIDEFPVPVEFQDNEAIMTEMGERYAEDLAKILKAQKVERITLVGHTDERGTDSYNMDLSLRRAEAVREYLFARGLYKVDISIEGQGKRQLVERTPGENLSTEEYWQICRRVEVKREGG